MEDSLKVKSDRDIFYYRQRMKNRVFANLIKFISDELVSRCLSKKSLAVALKKDPAQITRLLSAPSNLTLETISDLLLAMDAEIDTNIVKFSDRSSQNYAHPVISKASHLAASRQSAVQVSLEIKDPRNDKIFNVRSPQRKILDFAF